MRELTKWVQVYGRHRLLLLQMFGFSRGLGTLGFATVLRGLLGRLSRFPHIGLAFLARHSRLGDVFQLVLLFFLIVSLASDGFLQTGIDVLWVLAWIQRGYADLVSVRSTVFPQEALKIRAVVPESDVDIA